MLVVFVDCEPSILAGRKVREVAGRHGVPRWELRAGIRVGGFHGKTARNWNLLTA